MGNIIQMPQATPANQRVGMNVRIAMLSRGVDQPALGRALGLSQPSISRKLNGQTQWTPDEIEATAALLRVPIERLFQELPDFGSDDNDSGSVTHS